MVIFFVGLSLIKLWPKRVTVNNEVKNLEQKISEIDSSNSELSRLLDYFKSDYYREKEARLRLNYKKPDEKAAFVYREKNATIINSSSEEQELNLSNPQKWWKWLLSKE